MRSKHLQSRAAGSVVLITVLAACAACSWSPSPDPGASPEQPPTGSASTAPWTVLTGDGKPIDFTRIEDHGEATDNDYSVVGTISPSEPGDIYNVLAVDDKGRVLVDHTSESAYDPETNGMKEPGAIELWRDDGFTELGDTSALVEGDKPRQSYGGELTDTDAVWAETESADIVVSDWRIFRRDLHDGGDPELVATSEEVTGQDNLPIIVGDTRPVISNERIYWKTAYRRADESYRTKLVSVALGHTEVRDELDLTADPLPVDQGVVVFRMADKTAEGDETAQGLDRPDQAQDPRSIAGVALVRPDGSTEELVTFSSDTSDNWFPSSLAGSGTHYAFVLDGAVHVLSVDGDTAVQIPTDGDLDVSDLSVCDGRVVWALRDESSTAVRRMVFDIEPSRLVSVETPNSFGGTYCGGDYIAWGQPGAAGPNETVVTRWS